MAFNRSIAPDRFLTGSALDSAMVGIGMLFTAESQSDANIEDTVIAASILGMQGDLRVLSVLVTWLGVHHERLQADRLIRLVRSLDEARVESFWAAIAMWLKADRRLGRLQRTGTKRLDLLPVGTTFQIKRRGEDTRFVGTALRVPAGVLRDRLIDVLTPGELAKRHISYHHRILIGPTYRADMWALLTTKPHLSPSEIARSCYGSFATAWQVKRDFDLLNNGKDHIRRAS